MRASDRTIAPVTTTTEVRVAELEMAGVDISVDYFTFRQSLLEFLHAFGCDLSAIKPQLLELAQSS